jgi:hypothetical protein
MRRSPKRRIPIPKFFRADAIAVMNADRGLDDDPSRDPTHIGDVLAGAKAGLARTACAQ